MKTTKTMKHTNTKIKMKLKKQTKPPSKQKAKTPMQCHSQKTLQKSHLGNANSNAATTTASQKPKE